MKRKSIIVIAILTGALCALIAASIVLPKTYVGKYKKIFAGLTSSFVKDDPDTVYAARYEMSVDEWQEIEKELSEYEPVSKEEIVSWCLELGADRCFSQDEISSMMAVYRVNKYVHLPVARHWFRSLVSVCPKENGVSVYFAVYLLDGRQK